MATLIDVIVDNNGKVITLNNQPLCFMLPDIYHKVGYIASTGTQYINTNIIPTSDDLTYEWEGRDDTPSGYTSLFSCEYAVGGDYSNRDFGGVLHGSKSNRRIYIGKTTGMGIGYNSNDDLFHTWSLNINSNHKVYLVKDDIKLTEYNWTGSINRYNSIALFCNHTTSSFSQKASVAYKYFKIIDNGSVVFWGIPARRNSDNVLGMYDLVTDTFFINGGTGTFTAGPDIDKTYSVSFVKGSYVTNYTIDGITYTSNVSLNLTEGNHTVGVTGTYNSLIAQASGNNITGNSTTLVNGVTSTGAYSGTLNITSSGLVSIGDSSSSYYDFGTAPMTITFKGSMNSGGGSN